LGTKGFGVPWHPRAASTTITLRSEVACRLSLLILCTLGHTMDSTAGLLSASPLHGVILGPLRELYADRIVIADRTLFLSDGEPCHHVVGVILEVLYTEKNERACVDKVSLAGRAG
jgi:hypothetical protein